MCFAWSKTKNTSGERSWKQNGGSKFLDICMQRSTVMEFWISVLPFFSISRKCLLNGQTVAKTWCWRPSWPSEGQNGPLIMSKLRGYFPLFFRKTKNPLCSQGELVEKGGMALSQNTLKKIKISPRIYLFPSKDVNAMLKSILVTTANGNLKLLPAVCRKRDAKGPYWWRRRQGKLYLKTNICIVATFTIIPCNVRIQECWRSTLHLNRRVSAPSN